jgi:geranylgeranyl pyrophosphate synthase
MEPTTATFFDLVRPQLQAVESRMRQSADPHHPALETAIEHLLAAGGKRIRPTVALLAGSLLQAPDDRLVTLAAAIEMLHTATLVHDDLIDGALFRRGTPTLNAQWTAGATVLTGDYVFARAAQMAAQTGSLAVMESFARTLMTIVNGEISQLFREQVPQTLNAYQERIYAKTASLFELAAEGAALLAPGSAQAREPMRRFGYNIGVAFQIVDDVLDFIGQPTQIGKPVGSDLRHGIVTLPVFKYLEQHADDPLARMAIAGQTLPADQVDQLVATIRSSSAIDESLDEARRMADQASDLLEPLPDRPERAALIDLGRYVVQRTL